ncbi:GFA family protein [Thalassotalea crassostreae]|uniref:GFA family protein n=1 Tax=Thalassotalea crassostreae TaxID=1763536 RepID=UPI000A87A176|nr:GFA family protein [Thalassotalea crassostreae]
MAIYSGGCHCGNVKFEIDVDESTTLHSCNCSICSMTGYIHLIVPKTSFKLLTENNNLTCYQFNSKVAQHYFCSNCGIKSFYVPRSNPDGYSVNARCLDTTDWQQWSLEAFNGQDWESHAHKLSHLSAE